MNPSQDTASNKWLKKDIKTLCGFLHSFYVVNRPLDYRNNAKMLPGIRSAITNRRKEIILAGIRSARTTCSERYNSACMTIGNQLVRFTQYGTPDELIERFTKLAREEDAAGRSLEVLLHRVLQEELPAEVVSYDPVP